MLNFYISIISLLRVSSFLVIMGHRHAASASRTYSIRCYFYNCHYVICRPITLSSWQVSSAWHVRRYTFVTFRWKFLFFFKWYILLFFCPGVSYLLYPTYRSIEGYRSSWRATGRKKEQNFHTVYMDRYRLFSGTWRWQHDRVFTYVIYM